MTHHTELGSATTHLERLIAYPTVSADSNLALIEYAAERSKAFLAVRLCDVAPDGQSTRVTYGILNLAHRDSHETPSLLEPGQRVVIERWGGDTPLVGRVRLVEPFGFTKISALGIEEQRVNVIIDLASDESEWQRLAHGYQVDVRVVL